MRTLRPRRSSLLFLLLLAASFPAAGCSMIGFAIGAAADADDGKVVSPSRVTTLPRDTKVRVVERGRWIEGRTDGLETTDDGTYAIRYAAAVACLPDGAFPRLHESVTVHLDEGDRPPVSFHAELLGFDRESMTVLPAGERTPRDLELRRLAGLTLADGRSVDAIALRDAVRTGAIPQRTALVLRTDRGRELIPLDRVDQVARRSSGSGKLAGFLVGAVIDVVVVTSIRKDFEDGWGFHSTDSTGSIPPILGW